ncbi:hypothetical protein F4814DRAFT_318607 [Daldinia grandis]|nr:hypothetical protein F4814DRAFT_318607 [Daldinia grandis]
MGRSRERGLFAIRRTSQNKRREPVGRVLRNCRVCWCRWYWMDAHNIYYICKYVDTTLVFPSFWKPFFSFSSWSLLAGVCRYSNLSQTRDNREKTPYLPLLAMAKTTDRLTGFVPSSLRWAELTNMICSSELLWYWERKGFPCRGSISVPALFSPQFHPFFFSRKCCFSWLIPCVFDRLNHKPQSPLKCRCHYRRFN